MTDKPTAARQAFGDVAPAFAELTDEVLFGDVWERPGLSKRDRSLITVAALVSLYRNDQLRAVIDEHRARRGEARTLSGLTTEIAHLRTALEAIATTGLKG